MPRGYWIAHVDVADAEAYKAYVAANAAPFAKYGARFLVRAGRCEVPEGASRARQVVIEFKDYETALACYRSPEYQAAKALRETASLCDLVIAEGYDGPQPG
jgi:uncharacterized protein (DUF1330 family)